MTYDKCDIRNMTNVTRLGILTFGWVESKSSHICWISRDRVNIFYRGNLKMGKDRYFP